jgi:hypothetical protein
MSESDDHKRLEDIMTNLQQKANKLKLATGELSAKSGYMADSVITFAEAHLALVDSPLDSIEKKQNIASGVAIGYELDMRLDGLLNGAHTYGQLIEPAIPVFSTSAAAAIATCNSFCPGKVLKYSPCPYLEDSDENIYASKLDLLNHVLANVYRDAWQALHTDALDPGRPFLWQMRQVMDHFFKLLAPDDQVRDSVHWSPKSGDKPNAISRPERYMFAAHRWVTDPQLRNVFVESAKEVYNAYQKLNKAHDRNSLDHKRAEEIFISADAIVRRWIDAIKPWPPNIVI